MSKLYVVGIGPGSYENMTVRAQEALRRCDVIVGYTVYIDLVKEHFPGKEMLTPPMRKEVERCRLAFEEAQKGQCVAMICSGDAGVYGMSGVMWTLLPEYPGVEVKLYEAGKDTDYIPKYGAVTKSVLIVNESRAVTELSKSSIREAFESASKNV